MKLCAIQQPYPYTPEEADAAVEFVIRELESCDDSLDLILTPEYSNCPTKFPSAEASIACARKYYPALERAARTLAARNGRPAIVTAGDLGCLVATADGKTTRIPAVPVTGEIDICGAGDTFLAATACALAAGSDLAEAAALGCRAASVTIRKLRTTGTANWEELQVADMR